MANESRKTLDDSGEAFHDRIQRLRKERKLTLKEVADKLEISASTLCDYEKDETQLSKKMPGTEILVKLANYYGVSTEYLCCLTEAKNPRNASGVDGLGLAEDVIERLENWKTDKDIEGVNVKRKIPQAS